MEKIHIITGQIGRTIRINNLPYVAVAKDNIIGIINMTKAEPLYTPMDISNITEVSYSSGVLTIVLASSVPAVASGDKIFVKLYLDDDSVSSAITAIESNVGTAIGAAKQAIIDKLTDGGTPGEAKQAILDQLALRLGTASRVPTIGELNEAELRIKNAIPTNYAKSSDFLLLQQALTGGNAASGGVARKYVLPAMRGGRDKNGNLFARNTPQIICNFEGIGDANADNVILSNEYAMPIINDVSVGMTYWFPFKPELGIEGLLYLFGYSAEAEAAIEHIKTYVPVSVDMSKLVWTRSQDDGYYHVNMEAFEYAEVPAGSRVTLVEEIENTFTNPETGEELFICSVLLYRIEEQEQSENTSLTELKTLLDSMPKVQRMTISEYAAESVHDSMTIYLLTDNNRKKVIARYIGGTPIPLYQGTVLGESALGNSLLL